MPWLDYTLIGTTDTDYSGDLDAVCAEEKDVAYLLVGTRQVFPKLRRDDILYTTAGLRSLAYGGGEKPSDITREHKVLDHKFRDGIDGFVSVLGGKITAYRAVAKDAVDVVCRKLGVKAQCTTAEVPLPGAPAASQEAVAKGAQESGLSVETVAHLAALYGSRFSQVLDLVKRDKRGGQPVCSHCPDILAQVWHAVEKEGAFTVSDFLLRRSAVGLGSCQGLDGAEAVAKEMGHVLGWSKTEQQREVEAYRSQASLCQHFRARY
jgi:glycerol-3-phosphate dehydrogenase